MRGEQEQTGPSSISAPYTDSDPRLWVPRPHRRGGQCQGSQGTESYHRHRSPDASPTLASPTCLTVRPAQSFLKSSAALKINSESRAGGPFSTSHSADAGCPRAHRAPVGQEAPFCPAKRTDGAGRQPGLQLAFSWTCLGPHVALGTPRGMRRWRERRRCPCIALALFALEPGRMAHAPLRGCRGGCVRVRCMSACAGAGLHVTGTLFSV